MVIKMTTGLGVSMDTKIQAMDFRVLCCRHFGCASQEYELKVFWYCMHDHALVPARILHKFDREFFWWDFLLIRSLAVVTTIEEMEAELNNYRYQYRVFGFFRRNLRIRVSGQKILDLSHKLFSSEKQAQPRETVDA